MKITEFFIKKPTVFWSFVVGIFIAGIISYMQMPKLEDPAVAVKQAMVVIPYPGATAHEIELKVAQPMEDVLRTLPQIRKLKTECQEGMCQISLEYTLETKNSDLEQYFDLLRRKVNDAKSSLPQDCYSPVVVDDMMDVYGIFYALTGDGYSYPELEKYAKYIRRQLLTVSGVKRISISGTRSEVINITMSKEQIAQNGMIPTEIMMQLQSAGKAVSGGNYENANNRLQITVNDAVKNEEDIRNLKITTLDGKITRLGDIATVTREYAEPQTSGFFVNGKPALAICVAMNSDAVVPDVGKLVDAKLAETMKDVPAGMSTEKIFFQPDKVDSAINSFMLNLLESVLIVVIVLIFAMGYRSGLIIGFGLALTIALSFPILLSLGTTLQRISLGAFIIAMGMLVDNAIVIMDGILVDRAKGRPDYLFRIGKQTALPLLGATIIGASTFICIYMSPGSTGEYAGDLFLVLCVSLLCSWVLALIQVPVCANKFLPALKPGEAAQDQMNTKMHRAIRKGLVWLIDHRWLSISTAVIILLVCLGSMSKVKNLFFPDFDYKQFVVEYQLPAEAGPNRVKHDLLEITDTLLKNKDIERVAASMGSAPARYCLVRPMTNGGSSYGELTIDCKDFKTVQKVIPVIRKQLRAAYPEATIRFKKYNFSISTSHTIEVQFTGPDPAVLKKLSAQAEDIMRKSKYVDAYSVQNNWKPMGKMLVADYIQQDALRSRIQRGDVGNALQAATDGMTCGVLNENDKMLLINLKMRNEDGSQITDLNDIPVWSTLNVSVDPNALTGIMTGATKMSAIQRDMFKSAPLSNVANGVNLNWEEQKVYRLNGERAIEAECDPNPDLDEATPAKAQADIKEAIDNIPLPDGYQRRWVGESDTSDEAIVNLLDFLPITIFLILGILLLLFNSWRKIILILVCFPFVLVGICPSLLGLNIPFTFMAIIGLEGLIGMMAKNAIVLVDEITRLYKEEHQHPYDAVINATVSRVRPVIMASLTTILGMAPLLSDPMYNSMAICIMGGLTMGTIITLMLLPLFYVALYKIRRPETTEPAKAEVQ